jgi:hypothetical protein
MVPTQQLFHISLMVPMFRAKTSQIFYFNNPFAEFTNIWESPFDVTTTFDCSVNRTHGDPSTQMYLINHFLDTVILNQPSPDIAALNQTNAVSGTNSLGAQVNLCLATQGRPPNFLLVDVCRHIYSSGII